MPSIRLLMPGMAAFISGWPDADLDLTDVLFAAAAWPDQDWPMPPPMVCGIRAASRS